MRGRLVIAAGALAMALTPGGACGGTRQRRPGVRLLRRRGVPSPKETPPGRRGCPDTSWSPCPMRTSPNFQRRTVYCPHGKKAIGGGAEARGDTAILLGSFPTDDGTGWVGLGGQTDTNNAGPCRRLLVICADA